MLNKIIRRVPFGLRQRLKKQPWIVNLYTSHVLPTFNKYEHKIVRNPSSPSRWMRDTPDIALNERYNLEPPYPYYNPDSLCIHWVIPDFGIGAGGHMTIFRMVKFLESFGHRQVIWIQNAHNYATPAIAKQCIQEHYQPIGDNVIVQFLPENVDHISGDVVIATDCWTTFPMMQMKRFKERFYLIQDWEPMFHPVGDAYMIADLTYRFDLNALCAGKWLHTKAQERGMWSRSWDLASDPQFYYPSKDKAPFRDKVVIAFYARAYTSRRAVMLGVAALRALHKRGVDIHVQFFGQDGLDFGVDFSHEYLGILSPEELGNVYRNADIGMVYSATNYSLIPLEMMACHLPVIELDVESTRAVFDEEFVDLVAPDPLAIANRLDYVIRHPEILAQKADKALAYAQALSWENSARIIEQGIKDKLSESFTPIDTKKFVQARDYNFKASIIIPTYNAGDDFDKVLEAITTQDCDFDYEIVIVDSGSKDGTVEKVNSAAFDNLSCLQIANSEFQHGKTRNYAISQAKGEFVAVITQDATPANKFWLRNLIRKFEENHSIAGVFGAHMAYPEHSLFVKRDISQVFDNFNSLSSEYTWGMKLPQTVVQGSPEWQFILQYYSDNNSCMRKSVWEQLPYPEVNWGEDQLWAWMIIQLGLTKGFSRDALVYHSHDDDVDTRYKVSKIEGEFFKQGFGLNLYPENTSINNIIESDQERDASYGRSKNIEGHLIDAQLKLIESGHLGRYEGNM